MTFCELLIFILLTNIVSEIISTYIVKFIDKKHKNNRHSDQG